MDLHLVRKGLVIASLLVVMLSVAWMGCSTTVSERQQGQSVTGETMGPREYEGKFYFDDVRVPNELKYKPKKSFVYETPRFKAGILFFSKWRVDAESLIDYFTYNMEKDNWKLVNIFKGKESFINFSKPDKTCSIRIREKWTGTTTVEIQVGPLGERTM